MNELVPSDDFQYWSSMELGVAAVLGVAEASVSVSVLNQVFPERQLRTAIGWGHRW